MSDSLFLQYHNTNQENGSHIFHANFSLYAFTIVNEESGKLVTFMECDAIGNPRFSAEVLTIGSLEMPPKQARFDEDLTAYLMALKRLCLDCEFPPPVGKTWARVFMECWDEGTAFDLAQYLEPATEAQQLTQRLGLYVEELRYLGDQNTVKICTLMWCKIFSDTQKEAALEEFGNYPLRLIAHLCGLSREWRFIIQGEFCGSVRTNTYFDDVFIECVAYNNQKTLADYLADPKNIDCHVVSRAELDHLISTYVLSLDTEPIAETEDEFQFSFEALPPLRFFSFGGWFFFCMPEMNYGTNTTWHAQKDTACFTFNACCHLDQDGLFQKIAKMEGRSDV